MAHTPDECKSIFVSWQWLIGILGVSISVIATLSFSASRTITQTENDVKNLYISDENITKRIQTIEVINKDMDTIKTLLRGKYK